MTSSPVVVVHPDKQSVADGGAARLTGRALIFQSHRVARGESMFPKLIVVFIITVALVATAAEYGISDLHAMTTTHHPGTLAATTRELQTLLLACGMYGNVIRLSPPMNIGMSPRIAASTDPVTGAAFPNNTIPSQIAHTMPTNAPMMEKGGMAKARIESAPNSSPT